MYDTDELCEHVALTRCLGERRSGSSGALVLPVQPIRELRRNHGGARGHLAKIQTGRAHDENHGPSGHLPFQPDVRRFVSRRRTTIIIIYYHRTPTLICFY